MRFINEPFFDVLVADPRTRRLLSHKKSHKEVTEAYGTYERVRELLPRLDPTWRHLKPETGVETVVRTPGPGPVIFDACSGRGVTAALLSFCFPHAKIVMMDYNGAMDLSNVRALPNRKVVFRHVDLYGASVVEVIRKETAGWKLFRRRRTSEASANGRLGGNAPLRRAVPATDRPLLRVGRG